MTWLAKTGVKTSRSPATRRAIPRIVTSTRWVTKSRSSTRARRSKSAASRANANPSGSRKNTSRTRLARGREKITGRRDGMMRAMSAYGISLAAAPTIPRHPESPTVAVGSPAVFSVEASADTFSYEWKRNGVNIAGAAFALFLQNVQPGDAGGPRRR
jgi:hypothetical protein